MLTSRVEMAVQSPLMALLGSTLNPTEPIPSPSPQPEPEPEPEPEPRAAVAAARTPSPRASADGGAEDGSTPASSATKIYIETRVERKIPLQPGERCEFAVAVRDGMTVDASARFVPSTGDPIVVLEEQRSVAVQGSFECGADQPAGSLEIVLDNGFSWLTNKLVVLSLTQSTAEQRRRVEEEHAAIVEAQTKRRIEEEALRAQQAEAALRQAQSYIRCDELVQVREAGRAANQCS